jgi:hypothetical protein
MSQLWFEAQDAPPLILRLYARLPMPPLAVGTLIAAFYLVAVFVYFTAVGSPEGLTPRGEPLDGKRFWEVPGWWTLIVNAVMIGFAPTVMTNTLQSVERDVRDLAPSLGASPTAVEAQIREVARLNPWILRLMGLGVAAVMIAFTFLDPGLWINRERPPVTHPYFIWFLAQQILLGWLWSRAVVADVATARAFAQLSQQIEHVDLLDLRPLAVFARRGVRSVLYWMVGLAFFSLFWLGPYAGEMNISAFVLLIALAAWNLWVLLRGPRRRIRAEKEAQLARIRDEIRAHQQALLAAGPDVGDAAARLPALLAIEARIVSVGELPFDANTVMRFALYVTLGVGSWVGGAVIERLLGAALD